MRLPKSFLLLIMQLYLAYTENSKTCISQAKYVERIDKINVSCINKIFSLNDVIVLLVRNSKLPVIPKNAFSMFKEVMEIHLNLSMVSQIRRDAFSENNKLQKLYLNGNDIQNLEKGSFNGLHNLKILDLSHCNLIALREEVFDALKNLEKLNLSHNYLKNINNLKFSFAETLETFDISHNNLTEIDSSITKKLINLKSLLINNNNITKLYLLSSNNNLIELLDASFNQISDINTPDVIEFNMNNNEMKVRINLGDRIVDMSKNYIPDFTIKSLETEFFNGSWNRITRLSSSNFPQVRDLRVMDLNHNSIVEIDLNTFNSLKRLVHLNLSYNLLSEIKYGTFDPFINLETLDFSHNRFKFLYSDEHKNVFGFCLLSRLRSLHLNGNPWSKEILDTINQSIHFYADLSKQFNPSTEKVYAIKTTLTPTVPQSVVHKEVKNQQQQKSKGANFLFKISLNFWLTMLALHYIYFIVAVQIYL